jgi:TonB family protein
MPVRLWQEIQEVLRRVMRRRLHQENEMIKPHCFKSAQWRAATLCCLFLLVSVAAKTASAQQTPANSDDTTRGIQLYEQGQMEEAIATLRAVVKKDKTDADAWHVLGLSLHASGESKDARKAFETAIKLRPNFAPSYLGLAYTLLDAGKLDEATRAVKRAQALDPTLADAHFILGMINLREHDFLEAEKEANLALKLKSDFPRALVLKSQALVGAYLDDLKSDGIGSPGYSKIKEAFGLLEKAIQLRPDDRGTGQLREQLETLRVYLELADKNGPESARTVFKSNEVTTKARITSKPSPSYTEAARKAEVSGTVVLQMILGLDGKVRNIRVIRGLSKGLTEKSIQVARRIKFIPATKDGKPVSQYIRVEYNFNVY